MAAADQSGCDQHPRSAWQRHILDSGQLAAYLPSTPKLILDVGSGAGFPGLVLAIMTGHRVELVNRISGKRYFCRR